jgi:uncharacterized protein (TIGR02678 family)
MDDEISTQRIALSPTTALRRRRDRLTALESAIDAGVWDERRKAVRSLLSQPLLSPEGSSKDAFILVQKHRDWMRLWFSHHAGWQLTLDAEAARLVKRPARLDDSTRPCRDPVSSAPLAQRGYVILCLALASLVRADRQTTLIRLRDAVMGLVCADGRYEAAGIRVELDHQESRRDFVHALRLLIAWGVVRRVHGDEERFIQDADADALYNVHRPVLSRLLAASRPPSLIAVEEFDGRLRALAEDEIAAASEDLQHRRLRVRLFRQLLDDPVLYFSELEPDEREYLDRQRGSILSEIEKASGLIAEVRAEGIAMVDPTGKLTDCGLPEDGTDGHLTLLLATMLAARLRESSTATMSLDTLVTHTRKAIAEHHTRWRKNVREPGQDRALTRMVVARLCALGLARLDGDRLVPLPAIGRYGLLRVDAAGEEELF